MKHRVPFVGNGMHVQRQWPKIRELESDLRRLACLESDLRRLAC